MANMYGAGGSRSRQGAGGYVPAGAQRGRGTAVDAVGVALAPVAKRRQQQREEDERQRAAMEATIEAATAIYQLAQGQQRANTPPAQANQAADATQHETAAMASEPYTYGRMDANTFEANAANYAANVAARRAERAEERQARLEEKEPAPAYETQAEYIPPREAQAGHVSARGAVRGKASSEYGDTRPEFVKKIDKGLQEKEREKAEEQEQQEQRLAEIVARADLTGLYADDAERDKLREEIEAKYAEVNGGVLRPEELAGLTDEDKDMLVYLERQGVEDTQGKGFFDRLRAESKNSLFAEQYAKTVAPRALESGRQQAREYLEDENASPLGKAGLRAVYGANQIGEGIKGTVEYLPEALAQPVKNYIRGENEAVALDSAGSKQQEYAGELAETALHGTSGAGRFVGQTTMSIINNYVNRMLFGPASALSMGVQAGTGSAYDAATRGATGGEQFLMGIAGGAVEAAGEMAGYKGFEKLANTPQVAQAGVARLKEGIMRAAGQFGVEATEEGATELMGTIADAAIMGKNSEVSQAWQEYQSEHPGDTWGAALHVAKQVGFDTLMAALSGGISGGVQGSIATWTANYNEAKGRMKANAASQTQADGDAAASVDTVDGLMEDTLEGAAAGPVLQDVLTEQEAATADAGPADVLAEGRGPVQLDNNAGAMVSQTQTSTLPGEGEGANASLTVETGAPAAPLMESVAENGANLNAQAAQSGDAVVTTITQAGQPLGGATAVHQDNTLPERHTLQQSLQNNLNVLKDYGPVKNLDEAGFHSSSIKVLSKKVNEYFNSLGNKVHRAGFGDVALNNRGVKDSIAHGMSQNKANAFAAVPDVIKYGAIIEETSNWKGRGYDTIVFAAPVFLNGQRANMGVVVHKNLKTNRYYVHEVFDADGNLLVNKSKKDGTRLQPGGDNASLAVDPGTPSTSSINSIAENGANLNAQAAQSGEGGLVQEGIDTAENEAMHLDAQEGAPAEGDTQAAPEESASTEADNTDTTAADPVTSAIRALAKLTELRQGNPKRDQDMVSLYEQQKQNTRERQRLERVLRPSKQEKGYIDVLLKGDLSVEDGLPPALDPERVTLLYEARKAERQTRRQIAESKAQYNREIDAAIDDLLVASDGFKDKQIPIFKNMPMLYYLETAERNTFDVMKDPKLGQMFNDAIFWPVHQNEARANLFKEEQRAKIRDLELKKHEYIMVQIRGELEGAKLALQDGLLRDEAELLHLQEMDDFWTKAHGKKMDMELVNEGIEVFRDFYDEVLPLINEARARNGHEPIPYRRGYFPHFQENTTPGKLGKVLEYFGLDSSADTLPTHIAGITETFKPGTRWFANGKPRNGFETEYNAAKGFDGYLDMAADIMMHTDDVHILRRLTRKAREKYIPEGTRERLKMMEGELLEKMQDGATLEELSGFQERLDDLKAVEPSHLSNWVQWLEEYTNLLAGKKSKHDRASEAWYGRGLYKFVANMKSRTAANMVGLNVNTNMTNLIPLQQALAEVKGKYMMRAMRDTMLGDLRNDLKMAESVFMTNRMGSDALYEGEVARVLNTIGRPLAAIDNTVTKWVTRARYYQNQANGMERADAIKEADEWAASLMGDRSKGAMPTVFEQKNFMTSITTMFQLEVNNQLRHLTKDMPRQYVASTPPELRKKGIAALLMAYLKYLVGAKIFNDIFSEVSPNTPALDPVNMVLDTAEDATGFKLPTLPEAIRMLSEDGELNFEGKQQDVETTVKNAFGRVTDELPFVNTSPVLMPFIQQLGGEGGRIPITSMFPNFGNMLGAITNSDADPKWRMQQMVRELSKFVYYGALPQGGGQAKKTIEGATALARGGAYSYDKEGNEKLLFSTKDTTPMEKVQMLLFGKWASKNASDYAEGGFKTKSVDFTDTWHQAHEAGIGYRDFDKAWQAAATAKADKDAEGESISGTKQANMAAAIQEMEGLDAEQKLLVLGGVDDGLAEKINTASAGGADPDVVLDWLARQKEFTSDLDENGAAISGSRQAKIYAALDEVDATPEQKMGLLRAAVDENALNERAANAIDAGVDDGVLYSWMHDTDGLEADKDNQGKTIQGSKKQKALDMVQDVEGLDATQKIALVDTVPNINLSDDLAKIREYGIEDDVLLDWWAVKETIKPDVWPDTGKAVEHSRLSNIAQAAWNQGLDQRDTLALMDTVSEVNTYELLGPARAAGVTDDILLDWLLDLKTFTGDKKPSGGYVPNSKRDKALSAMKKYGELSYEQANELMKLVSKSYDGK